METLQDLLDPANDNINWGYSCRNQGPAEFCGAAKNRGSSSNCC